ncbi:MAG: hypothetical protein GY813_13040 [Halieaceae bacterium]|nr:hypothetical protein [Halieaceae bacterium]
MGDRAKPYGKRWPNLDSYRDELAHELAERGLTGSEPLADDVALAYALAAGDAGAHAILEDELIPDLRCALARFGRDTDFVDEALQRVRVKLLVSDTDTPRIVT